LIRAHPRRAIPPRPRISRAIIFPLPAKPAVSSELSYKEILPEPVPKPIDCALKRTVFDQALAVFQAKALQNRVF
jgi:hypothetical protein